LPPFITGHTVPAILALADGTVFQGLSIGASGQTTGEVVFNTAMTGYQEILTDPSYSHQLVALTYPHIGNTGINREDVESTRIHAAGLIIKDLPLMVSNFRSTQTLSDYLKSENIVAIAGIDTRKLTRILREKGAQGGAIVAGADATAERALSLARAFPGLAGMDLAKVVSTNKPYQWTETEWALGSGYGRLEQPLELLAIESTGPETYLVRYRYKAPRSAVCNGRAIVTTTTDVGTTLISRINALDGC